MLRLCYGPDCEKPIVDVVVDMIAIPDTSRLTRWSKLLDAMSSTARLDVIEVLEQFGEMSVGQLNRHIPLSQSALSQHLKILREAGIVGTRRDSQTIFYRLTDEDAVKILEALRKIKFS